MPPENESNQGSWSVCSSSIGAPHICIAIETPPPHCTVVLGQHHQEDQKARDTVTYD